MIHFPLNKTNFWGITDFDSFLHMAPILTLRGTPALTKHYTLPADETEERPSSGGFTVPNEKYRLFWDTVDGPNDKLGV